MFKYFSFCVFSMFLSFGLGTVNPGPKYPPTKGEPWPKPQYQKTTQLYYTFNPQKFTVKATNQTCEILRSAMERYAFIVRNTNNLDLYRVPHQSRRKRVLQDVVQERNNHMGLLRELIIELNAPCEEYPHSAMDESYDLVIASKAKLISSSIWGILRGLETWTQLFYFTDDYNEIRINETSITDFPRYLHRGLLLDTSRHFVSLSNILKTVDALAMNKMNVFHWHIVDDQSFPYQSERFPELSARGAFHHTMVYTKKDIEMVVKFARDRGIRVIPEFDVPGHTRSWGEAYPSVLAKCYNRHGKEIGLGPMDPTKNITYKLLQELIQEVEKWFPDKYFHIGGDEVELDCWSSNPEISKYMEEHNLTTSQLHGVFMSNVMPLLGDKLKGIVWQEVFDNGVKLSPDTLVQVWKNGWVEEMIAVLQAGHKVIFSASYYLDHLQSGGDWTDFYIADPRQMVVNNIGNASLVDNIVGGEACMWGEVVDDTNIISRTWPRASAVAERLWSKGVAGRYQARADAVAAAAHRLEEHTCRMRRRGVRAQPPNGPGVCVGAI